VKLYVPFALPGLKLLRKLRGNAFVTSYVKARFLTRDPGRIASYDTDPLLSKRISVNVLLGLQEAADRVVADAAAIAVPTQLLVSGADWVVHHAPQHAFFDRLGATVKERHVLHGFLHDTLGERDRAKAVDLARAFLVRAFDMPVASPDLDADRHGPTREEADALAAPLPWYSPRAWYWAATRAGLRVGGMLADGVRLGRTTGFDSGASLDYVYRDRASGRTPLGRRGRPQLPERHRVARRSPAQARLRVARARGRYPPACRGRAGRRARRRRRRRALRARRVRARARARRHRAARLRRRQRGEGTRDARRVRPRRLRALRAGRCVRPREPGRRAAASHARHRLGPLRAVRRQRARAPVARGPRRRDRARRLPRLHRPAVASAARAHRARAHQPPRRPRVGDAPPHAGELDGLVAAAGFRKIAQRVGESGIFTVSLAQRIAP
jgi:hypothetical protein